MKRDLTVGLIWMSLAACYTYRPLGSVDTVIPAAGTPVQVRLTTAGATALASEIGPDVLYLQGSVISADSIGLTLAVAHTETARRLTIDWKGERVVLPRDCVGQIEQRRLAVGATALVGGLAGGAVIAAATLFGTSGASSPVAAPPAAGPQ